MPAKLIKSCIFWKSDCVHSWDKTKTEANAKCEQTDFIFEYDNTSKYSFEIIENALESSNLENKLEFLKNISKNYSKNRFCC